MRYIFVDEAGTSIGEPVTVIVGIIADADKHIMPAERLVMEILQAIPSTHAENLVFHAADIFANKKYHSDWSLGDRLNILKAMMSVPRRIGMAVTIAAHWRGAVDYPLSEEFKLSQTQFEHLMAFSLCLSVADRNIRKNARANEVAAVVAEDLPELRKYLKIIPQMQRENYLHMKPEYFRETPRDTEMGYCTQNGDLNILRIRNSVHFVEKHEDLLVQVADACAYGIRRFFAQEKFGEDFAKAVLGDPQLLRNFGSPLGAECWWPNIDRFI